MSEYTAKKAAGRDKNMTDTTGDLKFSPSKHSNQEQFTGNGWKTRTVKGGFSNQLRVGPNTKGTGVQKRPSSFGEASKRHAVKPRANY